MVPLERPYPRRRFFQLSGGTLIGGIAGCLGQESESQVPPDQLPCRGNVQHLADVTERPAQGRDHVAPGTEIDYENHPPTSGTHYGTTVDAGFYEAPKPLGAIVHSLEHGAVVIYYEQGSLSDTAREDLRDYAERHTGTWDSVIAMPYGQDDPASTYALTAWRHILRRDTYDAAVVRSFIAEYLGRGPENNVRTCD